MVPFQKGKSCVRAKHYVHLRVDVPLLMYVYIKYINAIKCCIVIYVHEFLFFVFKIAILLSNRFY